MTFSEYNRDQREAIFLVRRYLKGLSKGRITQLKKRIGPYLGFRDEVADFQIKHLSDLCTQKCFTSRKSACCGREGIATFFADVVMNVLLSSDEGVDLLLRTLPNDRGGLKCVYLSPNGCLWHLKPIVCEMFLCENAKQSLLEKDDALWSHWEKLRRRERYYTWPNKPVLFDELEERFMQAGFDSPLMYFHRSPGLLRVKALSLKNRSEPKT